MSATPRGLDFDPHPEYAKQVTNVGWIILHVIEKTAVHSGHPEIARELLDGKACSADADAPQYAAAIREDPRGMSLRECVRPQHVTWPATAGRVHQSDVPLNWRGRRSGFVPRDQNTITGLIVRPDSLSLNAVLIWSRS